MELFGSSGARGIATTDLTPETVLQLAAAAVSVWSADRVAVARDTRTTGRLFLDAAAAGVAGSGADVDDLGVLPTPGVQTYAADHGIPGIVITASHNPPEYNGMKLITAAGVEADPDLYGEIERWYQDEAFHRAGWSDVGDRREVPNAAESYRDSLCDALGEDRFRGTGVTVAIDPGHGAGCETSPEVFARLGVDVLTVNDQPDGHFPGRNPEPVPDNLDDLCRLVRVSEADLGIAHDGDADRATFVDETGSPISGDTAFAALATATINEGDYLVTAVNVSQRVEAAVDAAGGSVVRTEIGSARIFAEVRRLESEGNRVALAGEGNGGIAFPEYRLARDGAYLAARFLDLVVRRPASDIAAEHGGYHLQRRKVEHGGSARDIMNAIESAANDAVTSGASVDTTDGYRIDYDDAWALIRPSGTEPVIRIVAESSDPNLAKSLADRFERLARSGLGNP